jgi:hypothetical protein
MARAGIAVAVSLGLHTLLLSTQRPAPVYALASAGAATTTAMSTRQVPAPPPPLPAAPPAPETPQPEAVAPTATTSRADDSPSPPAPTASAPAREDTTPRPADPQASAPIDPDDAGLVAGQPIGDFIGADRLTTRPTPLSNIWIRMPEDVEGLVSQTGIVVLFLDVLGEVVEVRSDTAELAPPYLQSARDAFLGKMFAPGMVNGYAVPTVVRIEVQFDPGRSAPPR